MSDVEPTGEAGFSQRTRLHLIDARDEAVRALRQVRSNDETPDRVRAELPSTTGVFERVLDIHAEQEVAHDRNVNDRIDERGDWSAEQYADRIDELLEIFEDEGLNRLVKP